MDIKDIQAMSEMRSLGIHKSVAPPEWDESADKREAVQ